MRKASLMLEFSDEVYDSLVEPLKRSKSFSKFLASLVNGYLYDSYIRDYIDDTLDGRKRAIADSLNESINNMSESLSNMGLFTDELESVSTGGRAKFKKKADEKREEIDNYNKGNQASGEVDKINSRIDGLQESINSIFELLKSNQGNVQYIPQYGMPFGMIGGMYPQMYQQPPMQYNVENNSVNNVQTAGKGDTVVDSKDTVVGSDEIIKNTKTKVENSDESILETNEDSNDDILSYSSSSSDDEDDFLSNIMMGNSFEF